MNQLSSFPYKLLRRFIWPRYREEGPPSHLSSVFFDKECIDKEGKIKEPVKSVLDFIVLGYRPVTTLSILSLLVENQNKPMYGAQIGAELEKKFQLPKGWFTKTRYYDNRISKLLKILCRLEILKETEIVDVKTKRRYVGYFISEQKYSTIRKVIGKFLQGKNISILAPVNRTASYEESCRIVKRCSNCKALTSSPKAKYCELCGARLNIICPTCGMEVNPKYSFCLYCGQKLSEDSIMG